MSQKVNAPSDAVFRWLAQILGFGSLITSVAFFQKGTDPVNLPKFFSLGITAGAVLGILLYGNKKFYCTENKKVYFTLFVFLLALSNSLIFSGAPRIQMWFGVFSRNNGFLTYFALAICMLAASSLRKRREIKIVCIFLASIGLINILFSFSEVLGYNPLRADNSFNAIIGNLGNPNFVSAFFGIFASVSFALMLGKPVKPHYRLMLATLILVSLYLVKESQSRQGLMVFAVGALLASLLALYFVHKKKLFFYLELGAVTLIILLGFLGAINIGPLGKFIFKGSINIRIEYWSAALNMFWANPATGVGLNSYGDYYRFARDPSALIFPGPNTFTNAAHNVYLDFAATGGFPLIGAYLAIILLVGLAALSYVRKCSHYDPVFTGIFVAWIGYSLQAFVSIDQIGLAIIGWVSAGLLISYRNYGNSLKTEPQASNLVKGKIVRNVKSNPDLSLQSLGIKATALVGTIVGVLLFLPPIAKDIEWRAKLNEGKVKPLLVTAISWPLDENRMSNTISLFRNNSLNKDALQVALIGVKNFPRSFYIHDSIYTNPEATAAQRISALKIMKELDPKNPTVQSLVGP